MAEDRKKRRRKAKVPVSSPEIPKLPYYSKLRREQVIKDRKEDDVIEEYPKVGRWPTENVRRRSYSYGMVHDGEKWVRRPAFYGSDRVWNNVTTAAGATGDTLRVKGVGELLAGSIRHNGVGSSSFVIRSDGDDIVDSTFSRVRDAYAEGRLMTLTTYDDANNDYAANVLAPISFQSNLMVECTNDDTVSRDFWVYFFFRWITELTVTMGTT